MQQTSATTLSAVGRSLAVGESPADTLSRAFREETGLFVLPVRCVGLYHIADAEGELSLTFRCILRGGEIAIGEGRPPAGYFDTQSQPAGLDSRQRRQLQDALHHSGGPPVVAELSSGWRGRLRRATPKTTVTADDWQVTARLIALTDEGIVWRRGAAGDAWRLPAAAVEAAAAPWVAAGRLLPGLARPPELRLLQVAAGRPALDLVFVTRLSRGVPAREQAGTRIAPLDAGGDDFAAADVALARDALATGAAVVRVAP